MEVPGIEEVEVLGRVCIKEEGRKEFFVVFASKKMEGRSSWSCLHQRRGKVEVLGCACSKTRGNCSLHEKTTTTK